MNESTPPSAKERQAALFASLVYQWSEMGLMLLGHAPLEPGKPPQVDLEHAQMVIDQLEMLEAKTRGNLSEAEATLLKRSLTNLRMAFVEAVEKAPAPTTPPPTPPPAAEAPTPAPEPPPPASTEPPLESHDSKVRYSKKY